MYVLLEKEIIDFFHQKANKSIDNSMPLMIFFVTYAVGRWTTVKFTVNMILAMVYIIKIIGIIGTGISASNMISLVQKKLERTGGHFV